MMSSVFHRATCQRNPVPFLLAGSLLFGCNEAPVPAPTGQLDSGMGAQTFSNDVPRMAPGSSIVGSAGGSGPRSSHSEQSVAATAEGGIASTPSGMGSEFYRIANESGSGQLMGSGVDAETRDFDAIEKAAAAYPELTTLDATKGEVLPAPDAGTGYTSIVDPAEGELPSLQSSLTLTASPSEIESIRFSSPAAAQAIIATHQEPQGKPAFSRLERYDLTTGTRVSVVDLPDRASLLDVSADGSRVLVRLAFGLPSASRPVSSQNRLDVWELTEAEGRHIVGWQPGGTADPNPAVPVDGAFVDGDRVISLTHDGRLVLWNLAEQAAEYAIETGSRGPLLVTPGRKYVVVFTGTTFGAFNAAEGSFKGLLSPPRPTLAACTDAGFSTDGTQLAAVLRRPAQSVMTWDVATGRPSAEIDAPIGLDRGIHFGSAGYLVAGGVLFDIDRKRPTWLYLQNAESKNVAGSIDQRHWVVIRPAFKETVLEAVDAPTAAVSSATLTTGSLAAPQLSPGNDLAVALQLEGLEGEQGTFEAALAQSLGRELGRRGIRLDAAADMTLKISASDRRTGESIAFNAIGPGSNETVPAHEVDFMVSIESKSGKRLWSESERVPPTYFLAKQEGKTLEQVLVESLWNSVPAAIADKIHQSMPTYVRSTPPEATLGQTRLWVAANDVSPPGSTQLVAEASSGSSGEDAAPTIQPSTLLNVGPRGVQALAVASSGWMLTTNDDGGFRVWQPVPQTKSVQLTKEIVTRNFATGIALNSDGTVAYYGTRDGQIRTHDLASRRTTVAHDSANGAVSALAVTGDAIVVAGTESGTLARWIAGERSPAMTIANGSSPVSGLGALPNSNQVVAAWTDGTAKLFDAGTGQLIRTFEIEGGSIHGVAVASDGTVAFATEARGAVVMSSASGDEIDQFGSGSATAVAFGEDQTQVAVGGAFGQVLLWRIGRDELEYRLDGAGGRVSGIVFSPDGVAVAAAVAGRPVVPVWNLSESGNEGPSAAHESSTKSRGASMRSGRPGMFRGPSGAH